MAKLMTWASHGPFISPPALHHYCRTGSGTWYQDADQLNVGRRGGEDPSILVNRLMATLQLAVRTSLLSSSPSRMGLPADKDDQDSTP